MCGITGGWWSQAPIKLNQKLQNSVYAMRTRGPNDQGFELHTLNNGIVALGHTRLSIIDLTDAGHQPMYSADKRYGIVFNGEIYNYREIRSELKNIGYSFYSDSDTEVLLAAWQHWGVDCLPRLVGMFAFVIFDKHANTLMCVRDPFGIKPFFYTNENGNFLFASEISAIKALKSEKIELDLQRAYDYLVHGDYDSCDQSFVAGVKHLLPGHMMQVDISDGKISESQAWWQPNVTENKNISFADAAQELRDRFLNNIRLHLRSDVPLGAALSGGVDSSAVVCAMRYIEPDLPINTFSYIAKNTVISEEHWIDQVNKHVNAKSHKIVLNSNELTDDLDDMILAQGEPFGSTSIYAQYRVFKLAKDHGIAVTLDGQGADELLAGYSGYPGKRVRSMLDSHRFRDVCVFLNNWSKWPGRSLIDGLKRVAAEYVNGDIYKILRLLNGDNYRPTWIDTNYLKENGVLIGFKSYVSPYSADERRLVGELAFSITQRGLPALLRHGDRNSMRWSVESRVPFLTSDLANFLLSLPEQYLISQNGETKSIFRAAMRGIVPDEILDRKDKIGFETPEKTWLIDMVDQIRAWITQDINLPFLDQKKIIEDFELIIAGKKSFNWQVWRWINFIRWYQLYFDQN